MENKPLVTVIVPVYKVEKYIKRCIDSIINQTYDNLEIILVDDGSPDNCGKICDEYAQNDKRIKVIHKPNGGQSSARNAALDIAKGDYIAFVDSDDYVENKLIEDNVRILLEDNSDMVAFNYYEIVKDQILARDYLTKKDCSQKYFFFDAPVIICSKIYRSKVWKDLRFPTDLKRHEDDFMRPNIIAKTPKISVNPKYYYHYDRSNENSVMTGLNLNSLYIKFLCGLEGIRVCEQFLPAFKNEQIAKTYRSAFQTYNADLVTNNLEPEQKLKLQEFFLAYEKETSALAMREKIFLFGYKHCRLINKLKGWDYMRKYKK